MILSQIVKKKCNEDEIKEINLVKTENNVQEINLYGIDTTSDGNSYNNQRI